MFAVDQLKLFMRVAEAKSFNRAASAEYISSNAVIKQMNNLENSLKVTLFNRTNKGIELTECGVFFYEKAKKIIDEIEAAVSDVRRIGDSECRQD